MATIGSVQRVAEAVSRSIDAAASLPDFQRQLLARLDVMQDGISSIDRSIAEIERRIEHIDRELPG